MDRRSFFQLLCAAGLVPLASQKALAEGEVWEALARPGALATMRHALAPGTDDPPEFVLGECSTQRNLDARGRDQARQTGARLRAHGITFDRVMSSQWCRCEETARLMEVGPVELLPALNSFYRDRADGPDQTAETLRFIADLASDERVLLVTHQVNITALTGRGVASGELFALRRATSAPLEIIGDFLVV